MRALLAVFTSLALSLASFAIVGPAAAVPATAGVPVRDLLAQLVVTSPLATPYNRDLFAEGIDANRDGCNTRREVLRQESLVPVTINSGCAISAGQWLSEYDGVMSTDPTQLEMDHLVALKEAWVSGAALWNNQQRSDYANDLDIPEVLIAVTGSSNSAKGASDPAVWLPVVAARCEYVSDWVVVKYRWKLAADVTEIAAIQAVLDGCPTMSVTPPIVRTDVPTVGAAVTTPAVSDVGAAVPLPAGTHRLSGGDRFSTAVKISERYSAGVPVVYIATGYNYPDALSAAAAAAALGGPLLLVEPTSLPAVVARELTRLEPASIVVVGGEAAVSRAVESKLQAYGPVRRVSGGDRFETSRKIASDYRPTGATAFLATGFNFPDALSASSAASTLGAPVILVNGGTAVDSSTIALLSSLGVSSVRIVGGPAAITPAFEQSLVNRFGASGVSRLSGTDRYSTGVEINRSVFRSSTAVFLAVGTNYADALAGGAYAGATSSPLFIVQSSCVPSNVRDAIRALNPTTIVILGGTSALSPAIESLSECAPPPPAPSSPSGPTPPSSPGDSKNCSDFSTQAEAQAWFDRYYPGFGDIARLDQNNDGIACESLR